MKQDMFQTVHPDPNKDGVKINRAKYEQMREAILDSLKDSEIPLTFMELTSEVRARLGDSFAGSISWYLVTVKLDLEARGIIERIPNTRLQQLRLKEEEPEAVE